MSLQTRLVVMFISIILAPVLLAGFVAFFNAERVLLRQTADQMLSLAGTRAGEIEIFIHSEFNILKAITSRTKLRNTLREYNANPTDEYRQTIKKILTDAQEPFAEVEWIEILNPQGELVVATAPLNTEESERVDDFFSQSLIEPQLFFDKRAEHIIVLGPIELDGEVLGVLAFKSRSDVLEGIITDYTGLKNTGEMLLAQRDEDGNAAFLHTRRFEEAETTKQIIKKTELNIPITQALLKKDDIFFDVFDYRGEPVIAATKYLPETDWGLVLKIDKSELFTSLHDFQTTLLIFLTIIILVTGAIAYAVAQALIRPIVVLTNTADKISSGDLKVTLPAYVMDEGGELGTLARSFHGMAGSLLDAQRTLEKKVQDRTQELHEKLEELERLNETMIGREEKMIELKKQIALLKKKK